MTKRGILVFNHEHQGWIVWIGQQSYWIFEGDLLELRIKNNYLEAMIVKDLDWSITLNYDVRFALHPDEVYKVRINKEDYIRANAPL